MSRRPKRTTKPVVSEDFYIGDKDEKGRKIFSDDEEDALDDSDDDPDFKDTIQKVSDEEELDPEEEEEEEEFKEEKKSRYARKRKSGTPTKRGRKKQKLDEDSPSTPSNTKWVKMKAPQLTPQQRAALENITNNLTSDNPSPISSPSRTNAYSPSPQANSSSYFLHSPYLQQQQPQMHTQLPQARSQFPNNYNQQNQPSNLSHLFMTNNSGSNSSNNSAPNNNVNSPHMKQHMFPNLYQQNPNFSPNQHAQTSGQFQNQSSSQNQNQHELFYSNQMKQMNPAQSISYITSPITSSQINPTTGIHPIIHNNQILNHLSKNSNNNNNNSNPSNEPNLMNSPNNNVNLNSIMGANPMIKTNLMMNNNSNVMNSQKMTISPSLINPNYPGSQPRENPSNDFGNNSSNFMSHLHEKYGLGFSKQNFNHYPQNNNNNNNINKTENLPHQQNMQMNSPLNNPMNLNNMNNLNMNSPLNLNNNMNNINNINSLALNSNNLNNLNMLLQQNNNNNNMNSMNPNIMSQNNQMRNNSMQQPFSPNSPTPGINPNIMRSDQPMMYSFDKSMEQRQNLYGNSPQAMKINSFTTGKISFDQKNPQVQTSHMQNVLNLYNQKMETFNSNNMNNAPNRFNYSNMLNPNLSGPSMMNPLMYQSNRMGQPQMPQSNITLTSAMASALYKIPSQINNTNLLNLTNSGNSFHTFNPLASSNGENNNNDSVDNEENKENEENEEKVSETEAKINVIMSQCETLSHRLRQLLHDHLKPFLEADEESKDKDVVTKEGEGAEEIKSPTTLLKDIIDDKSNIVVKTEEKPIIPIESEVIVKSEKEKENENENEKENEKEKETNAENTSTPHPPSSEEDGKKELTSSSSWLSQFSEIDENAKRKSENTIGSPTNDDSYIIKEQPASLLLPLKEHQLIGLNWLHLLHKEKLNGILADEMGLGKTVQTIALFTLLKERKHENQLHLIVCPSTTLSNWVREFQKWSPGLIAVAYYGNAKEREELQRIIQKGEEGYVIITTYNIANMRNDRLFLKKLSFNYLVLDEAQNIKNAKSLRHKNLFKLKAQNRLLLTGTPLQNNLQELWALLQFVMPAFFEAENIDMQSEDTSGNEEFVQKIKRILSPFFLRRLKSEVTKDLPGKENFVETCEMTPDQQVAYTECVHQSRSWWKKFGDDKTKTEKNGESESINNNDDNSDKVVDNNNSNSNNNGVDENGKDEEKEVKESEKENYKENDKEKEKEKEEEDSNGEDATDQPEQVEEVKEEVEEGAGEVAVKKRRRRKRKEEDYLGSNNIIIDDKKTRKAKKIRNGAYNELDDEDDGPARRTRRRTKKKEEFEKEKEKEKEGEELGINLFEDEFEKDLIQDEFDPDDEEKTDTSSLNNIFMQLRKVVNHPLLARRRYTKDIIEKICQIDTSKFYKEEDLLNWSDYEIHRYCKYSADEGVQAFQLPIEIIENCGKIYKLKSLLYQLKKEGHRVLLFSQMTRVLNILEELMTYWGHNYVRLDGSTPVAERQLRIDKYNDFPDDYFVFLLSTRAGGIGINLTTADTVIFYDISFNPQVDKQAEDRCHRLGQTKLVSIYRLITSNSVDEYMLNLAQRKAKLNDAVLEEGTVKNDSSSAQVLRTLLSKVFDEST